MRSDDDGKSGLASEVEEAMKRSDALGGMFLSQIPNDMLVLVHTKTAVYMIALIDKESGKIAFQNKSEPYQPPICAHLNGSTFGGSMLKIEWIGRGMYLELAFRDERKTLTTGEILAVELRFDKLECARMRADALAVEAIRLNRNTRGETSPPDVPPKLH